MGEMIRKHLRPDDQTDQSEGERHRKVDKQCKREFARLLFEDEDYVSKMFKDFKKKYPTGKMTMQQFKDIYQTYFPEGDSSHYAELLFKNFKQCTTREPSEKSNCFDFREYVWCSYITSRGLPAEDQIDWAFKIYDLDGDGYIGTEDLEETENILKAVNNALPQERRLTEARIGEMVAQIASLATGRISPVAFRKGAENHDGQALYQFPFQAIPNIEVTVEMFKTWYRQISGSDNDQFATHVFRTFVRNANGNLELRDLFWTALMKRPPFRADKLGWARDLLDVNDDGFVTSDEMLGIYTAANNARPQTSRQGEHAIRKEAERVFNELDVVENDGKISLTEVLVGGFKDPELFQFLFEAIPAVQWTSVGFVQMCQQVSSDALSAFGEHVFRTFRKDENGNFNFRDYFWTAVATRRRSARKDKLGWAFEIFDANDDGYISEEELKDIFTAINKTRVPEGRLSEEDIDKKTKKVFKKMDRHRLKKVSLTEFIKHAEDDEQLCEIPVQADAIAGKPW